MPRLSIFKSNKGIYAQVINDDKKETIVALSSSGKKNNLSTAKEVGLELAKMISSKGIKKVVFDRGGYIYTGKIQAFADAVREGGIKF
jgi:large subunit ribosomal protein L18